MKVSIVSVAAMTPAIAVLTLGIAVFAAEHTWTGAVSDKMCGTSHKSMGDGKRSDRDCTQMCVKGGTPYVLVVGGKVYQLTGHEDGLRTHSGHTVNLTGELKGETIRVSKIEMPES